jgi:hypothetical protein
MGQWQSDGQRTPRRGARRRDGQRTARHALGATTAVLLRRFPRTTPHPLGAQRTKHRDIHLTGPKCGCGIAFHACHYGLGCLSQPLLMLHVSPSPSPPLFKLNDHLRLRGEVVKLKGTWVLPTAHAAAAAFAHHSPPLSAHTPPPPCSHYTLLPTSPHSLSHPQLCVSRDGLLDAGRPPVFHNAA